MKINKYQSHERKSDNVWLNIWLPDSSYPCGQIQVQGDYDRGYRITRQGRLEGKDFSGLYNIILGDAGVFFEKRKDAENFALLLAMHLSGDLADEHLLDPRAFNGRESSNGLYSEARTELFWRGVANIDPTEGWDDLDPQGLLTNLPGAGEPLPTDHETYEFLEEERAFGITEAVERTVDYFSRWFLTPKVERDIHEILLGVLDAQDDYYEVRISDRGYVALLALAELRNDIPTAWVFPNRENATKELIKKLWTNLPADVSEYIAGLENAAQAGRLLKKRVDTIKARVFKLTPELNTETGSYAGSVVHCCASHFVEVQEGENDPPSHSEPEYRWLMAEFAERAIKNLDQAETWIAEYLNTRRDRN